MVKNQRRFAKSQFLGNPREGPFARYLILALANRMSLYPIIRELNLRKVDEVEVSGAVGNDTNEGVYAANLDSMPANRQSRTV
jgi:hypothetical protein